VLLSRGIIFKEAIPFIHGDECLESARIEAGYVLEDFGSLFIQNGKNFSGG
jgi:hypothetical protein